MPRILIVDDDHVIQELLHEVFTDAGYEVESCSDGIQVIPRLTEKPFDLVVLDVLIPHLNGFGVLEAMRGDPVLRDVAVIMVSGIYRSRSRRREMMESFGVVEYLDKPLSPDQLLDLVERAVGPGEPADPVLPEREPARRAPVRVGSRIRPAPTIGQGESNEERLVEPEARNESREVEQDAADGFPTSAFLLQGSIERHPVAALLGRLWHDRASGALLLRRGEVKKIVYVDGGTAYAVKSNLVSECLGQVLVRERLITEEVCAASVTRMKETGRPQGQILVEMQAMTEKNLAFALELQLEAKLFHTFEWEEGEFRHNPTASLPPRGPKLEWGGSALVIEGIRRAFDETRLRGLMIPVLDVPLTWRDPDFDLGSVGLTSSELWIVDTIELPRTARELLSSSEAPPTELLRVLYSLIAVELLVC